VAKRRRQLRTKRESVSARVAAAVGDEAGPAIDAPSAWESGWRRWLVVVLALLLILMAVYPGAIFRGEVFTSADDANFSAFRIVGDEAWRAGDYPLWNPYIFGGMPTFGSLAFVRFVYPPSFLMDLLQGPLGFPPLTWMFAHLLLGGLGMAYLLGRWRVPVAGQVLGAAIWILMPKIVAWGVHGHGSKLMTAMYLPWILAWTCQVLGGRGWTAVAWTGLLLGLQFLRGHVQISYYTLLAVGWLAAVNLVWPLMAGAVGSDFGTRIRRTGQLGVGLALGFLIGATLLVPVREYARLSIRGEAASAGGGAAYSYAAGWSQGIDELPTFVLPTAAGFGKATYVGPMPFTDYPNYFGFLLLILAGTSLAARQRRLALALGALGLLAVLIAFGRHFFLHRLLYEVLPFFDKFRVPSMILVLTGLTLAVLAVLGATRLVRGVDGAPPRWLRGTIIGIAALGGLLLLAAVTGLAEAPYRSSLEGLAEASGKQAVPLLMDEAWRLHRQDLIRIGLLLATAAAAMWLALRRPSFGRHGLLWVLALLVVWDLVAVDLRIVHPERSLVEVAYDAEGRGRLVAAARLARPYRRAPASDVDPAIAATLTDAVGHDRIWPLGRAGDGNRFMTAKLRSLGGYHAAKLAAYETIRRQLYAAEQPAGHVANWLAGRALILDGALPDGAFPYLADLGLDLDPQPLVAAGLHAYRNRAALPRARLVSSWRLRDSLPYGDDLNSFLVAIQSGRHPYRDEVVLEEKPDPAPESADRPLAAPEFVRDGLEEVVLRTTAPVPALLLLADMGAPGWRVFVDGDERPLLRADLALRAVALEAGRHEVRFAYHDPSVRIGLTLSLIGLGGVTAAFGVPWWGRRRPRKQPSAGGGGGGGDGAAEDRTDAESAQEGTGG